jgi:glycosyltransferase involved in cell wall biosynthesis
LDRFTNRRPSLDTAREKLKLPSDAYIAGVIGRLDPKKGQDVAIEAVRKVHESGHPMHLLVVAGTSFADRTNFAGRVKDMVRDYQLQDFIHFRDHQKQPEYAYAALDCFLMASQSETYGMVTIEAMASGRPVIGTADGGTLSLIDHEQNGLLVKPMDPDDMADALIRLIEHPQFAAELAAEAERRANERFSHLAQCEHWERLLWEVVDGSGSDESRAADQRSLSSTDQ